jgi:hypothetical protein
MNDENERSVASAGSAADEPDAWMHVFGGLSLGVFKHVDPRLRHLCIPLYRQPTLTDAEREAVRFAATAALPETEKLGGVAGELCRMHAARLRGLLERLSPPAT